MLFTDIEGSTHLLQQLGVHYAELLTACRQVLRTVFHTYRGHEVDTQGDALFAVFPRASDALWPQARPSAHSPPMPGQKP